MNRKRCASRLFILFFCSLWAVSCRNAPATPFPVTPISLSSTPSLFFPTSIPPSPTPLSPSPFPQIPSTPTLLPTASPTPTPVFEICSPLAWETIAELWEIVSDPYNPPPAGSDERHQGVDFSHYSRKGVKTIEGEPVQVVLPGRVAAVIVDRLPYGNMVMVETPGAALPTEVRRALGMAEGESIYLLYAHFGHSPTVNLSETVQCGQVIGEVGKTGYNIVNPHLHLEARLGPEGVTFESMAFYTTSATESEMENYRRWRTSGEFRHFDPLRLFEFARNAALPTPTLGSN
jgi:murein DD-endopeptidase MepM/ murein hydrolase activator NlpD